MPELADVAARFGTGLRAAGLPIGPDRCARFAEAITVLNPTTTRELYWCALATLTSDPAQLPRFDAVFDSVFRGIVDPAEQRGQGPSVARTASVDGHSDGASREVDVPTASAGERLSTRDFAELTDDELATLATLMRQLTLRTPLRRSRRHHPAAQGHRVDLR
ncbi:MAG TPA: hypothetical protein VF892_02550, partial [Pseudonocardiaceae bacterium]